MGPIVSSNCMHGLAMLWNQLTPNIEKGEPGQCYWILQLGFVGRKMDGGMHQFEITV